MQKKSSPTQIRAVSVPGQEGRRLGRKRGDRKGFRDWLVLPLDLSGLSPTHLLTCSTVKFRFFHFLCVLDFTVKMTEKAKCRLYAACHHLYIKSLNT